MNTSSIEYLDLLTRKAMRFFGAIAFAIYSMALIYCFMEERWPEMRIMAIATAGVGLLVLVTYFSIGKERRIDHRIDERPLEHKQKEIYHIE